MPQTADMVDSSPGFEPTHFSINDDYNQKQATVCPTQDLNVVANAAD